MNDSLPVALVHLREAEVVRVCGLARAARGQELVRLSRIHHAERTAGTLQATVLDGETNQAVVARFSDNGLEASTCSCSLSQSDPNPTPPGIHPLCEHVAALLTLWLRAPGQFRANAQALDTSSVALSAAFDETPFLQDTPQDTPAPEEVEAPAVAGLPAAAVTPAEALANLDQLDQEMRRFLNLLALAGGVITEHEAQQLFLRFDLGAPEDALAALERLHQYGLAQPEFASGSLSRHAAADRPAGWSIPAALLEHLSRVVPLTLLKTALGTPEQPPVGKRSENEPASKEHPEVLPKGAGLHEARAEILLPKLLLLVAAQAVDRSTSQSISRISQKPASSSTLDLDAALAQQWAPQLKSTPEQIRFCLGLLRQVGLLPPLAPSHAAASPTASKGFASQQAASVALARRLVASEHTRGTLLSTYRLLLARPQAEAARDLFTHWLHAHSAGELLELRDAGVRVAWLRQHRQSTDIAAENQAARQFIVALLRRVPAGQWWSFSSLVEFVWRFQPAFLRGRQQRFLRPLWWLERLPGGEPLSMEVRAEWRQAEGRYIALLMRRALHWLGMVDLALDAQGRLKGFRVTQPGAVLLGEETLADDVPAPATSSLATLQMQEDGVLLAPLDILHSEGLDRLLWWCEPAGTTAEALRFRPSAERTAAALDAGQDPDAWLGWLEQQPQSEALTALLARTRRWAGLYGQVRLSESAAVLDVGDPALLRELEMTLNLSAQFVDHTLADGLSVLRADAVEALVEEMRRRGYTPWIIEDETSDGP